MHCAALLSNLASCGGAAGLPLVLGAIQSPLVSGTSDMAELVWALLANAERAAVAEGVSAVELWEAAQNRQVISVHMCVLHVCTSQA